jgi:hypothetical protein
MLRQRYRRQVIFMPGFTRMKSGSSLLRANSSKRRLGEPSTLDIPQAPAGSSGRDGASKAGN